MILRDFSGWKPKSCCTMAQDFELNGIDIRFYPSVDELVKFSLLATYEDNSDSLLPDEVKNSIYSLRCKFDETISTHNEMTFLLWAKTQDLSGIVDWYLEYCGKYFGEHVILEDDAQVCAWIEEHPYAEYVVKSVFYKGSETGCCTNCSALLTRLLGADYTVYGEAVEKQTVQDYVKMVQLLANINKEKYSDIKNAISLLAGCTSCNVSEEVVQSCVFAKIITNMYLIC